MTFHIHRWVKYRLCVGDRLTSLKKMLASNERPSVSMHLKIIGIVVIFNHVTTLLPNPAKILRYKYLACFTAQSLDAQDILPLQALASQ